MYRAAKTAARLIRQRKRHKWSPAIGLNDGGSENNFVRMCTKIESDWCATIALERLSFTRGGCKLASVPFPTLGTTLRANSK